MHDRILIDAPSDLARRSLGDARLDRRLRDVSRVLQARPSESFPNAFGEDAALEGFYRLLANDRVSHWLLLDAHYEGIHELCRVGGHPRHP